MVGAVGLPIHPPPPRPTVFATEARGGEVTKGGRDALPGHILHHATAHKLFVLSEVPTIHDGLRPVVSIYDVECVAAGPHHDGNRFAFHHQGPYASLAVGCARQLLFERIVERTALHLDLSVSDGGLRGHHLGHVQDYLSGALSGFRFVQSSGWAQFAPPSGAGGSHRHYYSSVRMRMRIRLAYLYG